jgi:hypothetical protein
MREDDRSGHQMTSPHLTLKVERNEAPAADTHVISYCVTEA